MVDNFPNNSHRAKDVKEAKPESKKIEKVTTGEVARRKKPLGKRFSETFLAGDDVQGVWGYVVLDVLVPAAKDAIADAVSQGIERMIYGEARSTPRRGGRRTTSSYSSGGSHIAYNRFAPSSRGPEPERGISRRSRASHDFDEIIIETRVEAEEVIDKLFSLVSQYEVATVADLYDLVGISGDYTDAKWGWSDLRGASIRRIRDGYLLDIPKPEPLN